MLLPVLPELFYYHGPTDQSTEKEPDYTWSTDCQDSFVKVKALLILMAPDFQKQFIIMTDASDIGV